MPQVGNCGPREFKFVGGPSRKRRRNAPRPPSRVAPQQVQQADGSLPAAATVAGQPQSLYSGASPTGNAPLSPAASVFGSFAMLQDPLEGELEEPPEEPLEFLQGAPQSGLQSDLQQAMPSPAVFSWPTEETLNPFFAANLDPFLFDVGPLLLPATDDGGDSADSADGHQAYTTGTTPDSQQKNADRTDHPEGPVDVLADVPADARLFPQPSARLDTLTRMFSRYDQEFCIIPITHDCRLNPFRFSISTVRNFNLLRHCVLALSYKHVSDDTGGACAHEAAVYRRRSLQLLRREMKGSARLDVSLLDAVIVLLTLNCATSGFGLWSNYILRTERIIRAMPASSLPPQHHSQLTLIVFFDVILALTNRSGARLPASATRSATEDNIKDDFFAITGCPTDLFCSMVHLAAYANEHRLAASMSCVRFHDAPVRRLQSQIANWSSPEYSDPPMPQNMWDDDEEQQTGGSPSLDDRLDRYHCAEAWRHALLLYIGRVFAPQGGENTDGASHGYRTGADSASISSPTALMFLARKTLNHVKACRSTNMVQKQLLMPVFLAGCETSDEGLRADARAFCAWWSARTRYHMFITARALLEDVWRQGLWWGAVLDQRKDSGKEYLLG